MKPTIALVGRPNVGKSTLFNRLTRSRDAIVADFPGLTRDRHYGHGRLGHKPFLVVDTGGFEPLIKEGIMHEMARQTEQAIAEADAIIFVVDGRGGLTPQDKEIANKLRRLERPVFVAVNKTEGMNQGMVSAEFHELGLGDPHPISASHGEGVRNLVDMALDSFPEPEEEDDRPDVLKVAIAGRPNVGKSTLINALIGEERVIAFDMPGTTRDAIYVDFERNGKKYSLIDTAGLRKKGKVFEAIEKFSVVKTLQSIEDAHVVILMLDAQQDISDQDAHVADFVVQSGRALVVAVNKWDGLDHYAKEQVRGTIERKLKFLEFAKVHFISAKENIGLDNLFKSVNGAYAAAMAKLPTPKLTRVLIDAVARQAPPRHGAFRPKMRYAHQGGSNPPIIVIHGNALEHIPNSYQRYLENIFRHVFKLDGTPLRIQFNTSHNPYADKD
ncbi:ribosome biogenesis GTPase Der [Azovibrio restrictus]|uniref:ribosome biogenesis GTPase Der n=1 Tax=Azovibrio restrictus TaxID=146938 RepID=UPI0026EBB0AB|nr:ribosome biogenesis GTPase Der [Azovibrio restrictus]MDD3484269.1 ribosome biogenesis GTPase Der [Azovibrio restrictus]